MRRRAIQSQQTGRLARRAPPHRERDERPDPLVVVRCIGEFFGGLFDRGRRLRRRDRKVQTRTLQIHVEQIHAEQTHGDRPG